MTRKCCIMYIAEKERLSSKRVKTQAVRYHTKVSFARHACGMSNVEVEQEQLSDVSRWIKETVFRWHSNNLMSSNQTFKWSFICSYIVFIPEIYPMLPPVNHIALWWTENDGKTVIWGIIGRCFHIFSLILNSILQVLELNFGSIVECACALQRSSAIEPKLLRSKKKSMAIELIRKITGWQRQHSVD